MNKLKNWPFEPLGNADPCGGFDGGGGFPG